LGVKTYFTKPFDIDKLRESVREWFASAHAAESTHTHA